ncbi:hypothetical protein MAR_027147, partial [Mya arenaria]
MDGKKWLETRDKVYKLIGVLPENSELFLMAVGQRTIHLNISKTGSDWKSSVLDMTFMTKHNGSVSGISLEHNRQVCFPDNSLPKYYVPSMPEISWIFTLSTTEILENVDTHNKKSYVMLMDNEPDKSKWYHMATTRRHVIDLNSFDRLPFMLTKDTHLLCDVNMYYSTGLCKPCGEFCYGDGPNTPFCSGEKKQCSRETASFQPNAHQTPPHTPSPPPGVTSNLLPNTQPIDGAVGGVEEQSGPQNT